jgi:hypothetical protein
MCHRRYYFHISDGTSAKTVKILTHIAAIRRHYPLFAGFENF